MDLIISLGHNSSAIAINASGQLAGYEQERLSRLKSSSAFPAHAIEEALQHVPDDGQEKRLFVSHWFDHFDFHTTRNPSLGKYFDYDYVDYLKSKGFQVIGLSPEVTHHDAHAWSAISFFENHYHRPVGPFEAHVLVADGFGNQQEVISVYKVTWTADGGPKLKKELSIQGYSRSLGLLYQYATSFCGMKENQDEYKFLGYESHIREMVHDVADIDGLAAVMADKLWLGQTYFSIKSDHHINVDDLNRARAMFTEAFEVVCQLQVHADSTSSMFTYARRCLIGYFIQKVLEEYYTTLLKQFNVQNVLLAGGVHYNVKLNNLVTKLVPGLVSIVPLAGDQGGGIGLYRAQGNPFPLKGLLWGHRTLGPASHSDGGIVCVTDRELYVKMVTRLLLEDTLVNTVTGSMEFGPRALCNTSTLALASNPNVTAINSINGRDTVMPFAGVMLASNLGQFHKPAEVSRVVGSLQYMVTTLDYTASPSPLHEGVMHHHPTQDVWTGRPQAVPDSSDRPICDILKALGPKMPVIINTSLNMHGMPIVYSVQDAAKDFAYNLYMADKLGLKKPVLVIGNF